MNNEEMQYLLGVKDGANQFNEYLENADARIFNVMDIPNNSARCLGFYNGFSHCQKQLFENNNIPLVILKGTAAAMYYPKPQLRTMGDIDFLVFDIVIHFVSLEFL